MLKVKELPALSSKVSPEVRKAFNALLNILKQGSDSGGFVTAYDLSQAIEGAIGEGATGTKPGRPEGLRADSGFNFIILTVNPPPASWNVSYTEFLRAPVDDFDQAQLVGRVASTMFPDLPPDSSVGVTYYYWCRFVNAVGTGPINQLAGTPGTTATDPAYLLDLLTGQVTKSQLYQDLRAEVDLIPVLDGAVGDLLAEVDDINAAIINMSQSPPYDNTVTYQAGEIVVFDGGLYQAKQVTTGNLPTDQSYWEKIGDYASLGEAIAGVALGLDALTTLVAETEDGLVAEVQERSTLAAQLRGNYTGDDLSQLSSGLLYLERVARATGHDALAQQITMLAATVGENTSAIQNEATTRVSEDDALAEMITLMAATVDDNTAAILLEASNRTAGDSANADLIATVATEVDGNTAAVQTHAQSIDGLSAQLTFKVDVNGFPAGIGLASEMVNGTPFSQIISIADRHAFVNPAATVLQITAMSRLGSTVTVTTNGVHNLSVDEYVVLTGAEQHEYNGTQKVTQIVSSTQFRFTVTGTPASPATVMAGFPGLRCMKAVVPMIVQDGQVVMNEALVKNLTSVNFVGQKIVADELSAVLASSYQQIIGWLLQSADGLVTLDMTNKQLKMQTGSRYVEITPGRMVFNNGSINLLEFNNGTLTIRRSDGTALLTSGGGLGLKVVGGANIDDLSVDTLQIANNAVTVPVLAAISGSIDASTEVTVAQCSIGIPNIPYAVSGQFLVASGGGTSARLKLYFNTTLLYDTGDILKPRYSEDIGGDNSNWVTYYFDLPMHVNYGYTPSVAGTFYLKAVGSGYCDVSKRSLVAIGSRK